MRRVFASSGDLVVDGRFKYAADLAAAGRHAAAADLLEQTLALAPRWTPLRYALGSAYARSGESAAAAAAFRTCLELDPEDRMGAGLELARLGAIRLDAIPQGHVVALFDGYADDFDEALSRRLGYAVPGVIAARIGSLGRRFPRALDLGCGSGLCGAALRPYADYLEGVDLSPRMIARASGKGVYDALHCASLIEHLATSEERFDLIAAADVFPYIGDLAPVFAALAPALASGGVAIFTVEAADGPGWTLLETRRFAHGAEYLERLAAAHRLAIIHLDRQILRFDRGAPVDGFYASFAA